MPTATAERLAALSPAQRELFHRLLAAAAAGVEQSAPESPATEPIAVIGMGCRFPGGVDSPEAFWKLLCDGRDAVGEVPRDRWDIDEYYDPRPETPGKMWTRNGAFLDQVDRFDAAFFGISPREAAYMDPQQRLLLEVAWEALEHAGIAPDSLSGSSTGVFAGMSTNDYFRFVFDDPQRVGAYCATGTYSSAGVGRISYTLGFHGPSMAVDTACSSSLVAAHLACQSLRQGECDLALVAGAGLLLAPSGSINFTKARMLARDGRCKTFDAAADGYGRGEGCGVVVLKPLAAAQRDGDRIWAVILGSAVNQDGRSNGLTAPNALAQEALLRAALAAARVEPSDVSYVEAHGTGTPLGDPIEVAALASVLGRDRAPDRPLVLGAVKTNIGHLELAAGVAGLIKTALCLANRQIPGNLHFKTLNPQIAAVTNGVRLEIPTRLTDWRPPDDRYVAGVSSFGFGGTNAHVVMTAVEPSVCADQRSPTASGGRQPPVCSSGPVGILTNSATNSRANAAPLPDRPLHLFCLSAKTPAALAALACSYADFLMRTDADLADVCYTANAGRAHFEHRLAVIGSTRRELAEKLAQLSGSTSSTAAARSATSPTSPATNGELSDPHTIAVHYLAGGALNWRAIYSNSGLQRIALPTYPFQRERYWLDIGQALAPDQGRSTPSLMEVPVAHAVGRASVESSGRIHPLLGLRLRSASRDIIFESYITPTSPAWLADHVVRGSVVVPGTTYAELALAAARSALPPPSVYHLLSTELIQFLPIDPAGRLLQTILTPQRDGAWQFTCSSADPGACPGAAWTAHATGTLSITPSTAAQAASTFDEARARCTRRRDVTEHYQALSAAGLDYGPAFRGITELWSGDRAALARIELHPSLCDGDTAEHVTHPALLDACLQTFLAALGRAGRLYVPVGWEEFALRTDHSGDSGRHLWAFGQLDVPPAAPACSPLPAQIIGHLTMFDSSGAVVFDWRSIRLECIGEATHAATSRDADASTATMDSSVAASETAQSRTADKFGTPTDELLTIIADCAARVLELPSDQPISGDDDLYNLGMDSIMATELLFNIEKALGQTFTMEAVTKSRTPDQFARYIRAQKVPS